jgi:probable F420-dependent oxidoreductase
MKVDTTVGSIEAAGEAAAAAEADGYDGIFTGEVGSDPFLPLVQAAAQTERLEIGTSIAVAFARSPMALAYTAWDLQRFSRGRFRLGLGSQVKAHITRRYSMPWGDPVAQLREFVEAMQAAWRTWATGEPLAYESTHYRHTLMPPTFVPPGHDYGVPPVLLAGVGDAMTTMAGEVADGFLCHAFTTEKWIREHTLPALTTGRQRAGRSLDGLTVKAAIYLATGTDEQIATAVKEIKTHLGFYGSTPAYRPILELHGWGDLGAELTRLSKLGRWAELPELIDDDVVEAFALVGQPDAIPARLTARCAGIVNRVSFLVQRPSPALLASLRASASSESGHGP